MATTSTSHHDVSPFAALHSDVVHFGVDDPSCHMGSIIGADYRTTSANADMASTLVRFGTTMGDVSLTLGLRHAGNLPEKSHFSVRDFGGC
ncbi:hypothetical protein IFM89_015725 [Coptis chinensis]|uniref:Uncharacterized protein n=1 Tax=Coptis chinensis TaxID=261450 RepID=A0A835M031_9MAGN|nr:hypothetical protein IFM89_015725 [Coptis chinensis]